MRVELQQIEEIENYLLGKMNTTDKNRFEEQLGNDPSLRSKADFQVALAEGIQRIGLKTDAHQAYGRYRLFKFLKITAGITLLTATAVLTYIFASGDHNEMLNESVHSINSDMDIVSLANYELDKETGIIESHPIQLVSIEDEVVELGSSNQEIAIEENLASFNMFRPRFDRINDNATNSVEDNSEVIADDIEEDTLEPKSKRLNYEVDYLNGINVEEAVPWIKTGFFKRLFLPKSGRLESSQPQFQGTILKYPQNQTYAEMASLKQELCELNKTKKLVDNKSTSVTDSWYRIRKNREKPQALSWDIRVVQIDSVTVDIILRATQYNGSHIYSTKSYELFKAGETDQRESETTSSGQLESGYNMPTQFLFRIVEGDFELEGSIMENGSQIFPEEPYFKEAGPAIYSEKSEIEFKQRIKLKTDSVMIMANYAYMLCAYGIEMRQPEEDSATIRIVTTPDGTIVSENLKPALEVSTFVDVEPEFPGGEFAMTEWLSKNINENLPEFDEKDEGTIYVGYTISETGEITDIKIVQGLTPELDQYILDVMSKMPKWSPAVRDKKNVPVYFTLPINIKYG